MSRRGGREGRRGGGGGGGEGGWVSDWGVVLFFFYSRKERRRMMKRRAGGGREGGEDNGEEVGCGWVWVSVGGGGVEGVGRRALAAPGRQKPHHQSGVLQGNTTTQSGTKG